jgi:hypothetical protein
MNDASEDLLDPAVLLLQLAKTLQGITVALSYLDQSMGAVAFRREHQRDWSWADGVTRAAVRLREECAALRALVPAAEQAAAVTAREPAPQ